MSEYVALGTIIVAGMLLALSLLVILALVQVVAHGEEMDSAPCLCGSPVLDGEEYVVGPDGDRLFHRGCIPPQVTMGGDDVIRIWIRQNDQLNEHSKDDRRSGDE